MILFDHGDTHRETIMRETRRMPAGQAKNGRRPELWDRKAANRIVSILAGRLVSA